MKVRYVGTAPMTYKGVKFYLGQELEVSDEFFALHQSRLQKITDDAIEAEFTEVTNVEPVEIQNVTPKKKATKRKAKK